MQLRAVEKSVPRDYVTQKLVFVKVEVNPFVYPFNNYTNYAPIPFT